MQDIQLHFTNLMLEVVTGPNVVSEVESFSKKKTDPISSEDRYLVPLHKRRLKLVIL